jgi:protease-4
MRHEKDICMTLSSVLKNIFFLLLFLLVAPALIESIQKRYTKILSPKTSVGVISINGILYDSNYYNKCLHQFFNDDAIAAILLKIECPGGAAGSSQALYTEIVALKKEHPKPVIALVENLCASGGYYVACAADYIVAPGSAMIGSIGVYLPYFFQLRGVLEHLKIEYVPLKAGSHKAVGDPFVQITPEQKAFLQHVLDDTYHQFAEHVAFARKLDVKQKDTWADGKIFSGKQAYALGLIDAVGSAHTAIEIIKERALIEGEIEWIQCPEEHSVLSTLVGSDDSALFEAMQHQVSSLLHKPDLRAALDATLAPHLQMR